jgi:hypothetical protein
VLRHSAAPGQYATAAFSILGSNRGCHSRQVRAFTLAVRQEDLFVLCPRVTADHAVSGLGNGASAKLVQLDPAHLAPLHAPLLNVFLGPFAAVRRRASTLQPGYRGLKCQSHMRPASPACAGTRCRLFGLRLEALCHGTGCAEWALLRLHFFQGRLGGRARRRWRMRRGARCGGQACVCQVLRGRNLSASR